MEQLFPATKRLEMRRAAVELFGRGKFREAGSLVQLLMTLEEQPLPLGVMNAICLIETGDRERAEQLLLHVDQALASSPEEERAALRPLLAQARSWTLGRWSAACNRKALPSNSLLSTMIKSMEELGR